MLKGVLYFPLCQCGPSWAAGVLRVHIEHALDADNVILTPLFVGEANGLFASTFLSHPQRFAYMRPRVTGTVEKRGTSWRCTHRR